jgi:hypothetical protein
MSTAIMTSSEWSVSSLSSICRSCDDLVAGSEAGVERAMLLHVVVSAVGSWDHTEVLRWYILRDGCRRGSSDGRVRWGATGGKCLHRVSLASNSLAANHIWLASAPATTLVSKLFVLVKSQASLYITNHRHGSYCASLPPTANPSFSFLFLRIFSANQCKG